MRIDQTDFSVLLKKSENVLHILVSQGAEGRLVGGCVRDAMLGKHVADIDIAVNIPPNDVVQLFQSKGVKVIPTGIDHGTVTVILDYVAFELTSLRKDVRTDGRHALVSYTTNWIEDAERRDFTINALYLDQNCTVHDYFNGIHDLERGIIRFIGDPYQRINEDYLRILRYYRFVQRFSRKIDDLSCVAVNENVHNVKFLSKERVQSELFKILVELKSTCILIQMKDVLYELFHTTPNFDLAEKLINHCSVNCCTANEWIPLLRLFSLFPRNIDFLKQKLKLSHKQLKYIDAIVSNLDKRLSCANLFCIRHKCGDDVAKGWFDMNVAFSDPSEKNYENIQKLANSFNTAMPAFPLTGKDLIDIGITPGIILGQILNECKQWWCEKLGQVTKSEAVNWCRTRINSM
ncbi:MAG: CCA tRNA nucleotidyltransferase [Holosporales bacterium]|nr:CCA tRNA nucleotidyltransferase [Holosporales bacterium]